MSSPWVESIKETCISPTAAGLVLLGSLSNPAQRVASVPSLKALVSRMTYQQLLHSSNRANVASNDAAGAVALSSFALRCGKAHRKSAQHGTDMELAGDRFSHGHVRWGLADWLEDRTEPESGKSEPKKPTDSLSPRLLQAYYLWRRRMEALLASLFRPVMVRRPCTFYRGPSTNFLHMQSCSLQLYEGDVLFQEGDEGDCAYVVVAGEISLSVTSVSGSPILLRVAMRGDCVGESGFLHPEKRSLLVRLMLFVCQCSSGPESHLLHRITGHGPYTLLVATHHSCKRANTAVMLPRHVGYVQKHGCMAKPC